MPFLRSSIDGLKDSMEEFIAPKRKTKWVSVIFYAVLIIYGVIGAPLYVIRHGISKPELALFLFYFFATGMAITVGYHRLFTHVTFKASPLVRFFLLFFGAATFEESALKWSSQHRQHHQFTDTEKDPHSVKRGIFFSHIGWIMFYRHRVVYDNVKDLQQSRLMMSQHRYYYVWAIVSGILIPLGIGYATGHLLGAFLISVCFRLFVVQNAAFLINSYAHLVGDNSFDRKSSARDHWLGAIITNGEGYHSFHHRFPGDYRNGYRWYHWDPSKWFIYLLSSVGLVTELRRTPDSKILASLTEASA
jgi:stearoyl-CoA desaturase (Delta-9 desaturase)